MENLIRRVCISYELNKEDRVEYLFLSEFFRTLGIYVHEDIRDENKTDYEKIDYPIIVIGEVSIENENVINYDNIKEKYDDKKAKLKELTKIVNIKNIDILIDIYVDYDIMFHILNMRFYPKDQQELFKKNNLDKIIKDVFKTFDKYDNITNENEYIDYAYLYYLVKECEFSHLARKFPEYDIENLEKLIGNKIKTYPEISNFSCLLGILYSLERGYNSAGIHILKKALLREVDYPYSSFMYYLLGKIYGEFNSYRELSNEYSKKSFERSNNIRSLKILSANARENEHYQEAINFEKQLLINLKEKREKNVLLPSEILPIFQSYWLIMHNLDKLEFRYGDIINYGNKLLNTVEEIESMGLYNELYGKDKENYINLTKSHITFKSAYYMLAQAYSKLNEPELASKYYRLSKKS